MVKEYFYLLQAVLKTVPWINYSFLITKLKKNFIYNINWLLLLILNIAIRRYLNSLTLVLYVISMPKYQCLYINIISMPKLNKNYRNENLCFGINIGSLSLRVKSACRISTHMFCPYQKSLNASKEIFPSNVKRKSRIVFNIVICAWTSIYKLAIQVK